MKKITIILIIYSLFGLLTTQAQNWQFGGNTITSPTADYFGGNGSSSADLSLKCINSYNMNFYTGNNHYMTIDGTDGKVGIGTTTTVRVNPPYRLTVNDDIDVRPTATNNVGQGYRINGNLFMSSPYVQNTMIGLNTGNGLASTSDQDNTFVGNNAGMSTSSSGNTFCGSNSGPANTSGFGNVFMGAYSGIANTTGYANTIIGSQCGNTNTTGFRNTWLGFNSGGQTIGVTSLENTTAIGYQAIVKSNDQMILGNNSVHVGIGLSNDATGPRDKLEIKSGTNAVSGLQFYNVTTSNFPVGSTASTFLTVDGNGKVILKDVPGGGGSVTACSGAPTLGWLTKWSSSSTPEICKSKLYETTTTVGVGYTGTAPTLSANVDLTDNALDVYGNLNIQSTSVNAVTGNPLFSGLYFNKYKVLTFGGVSGYSGIYLGVDAGPLSTDNNNYGNIAIGSLSGRGLVDNEGYNIFVGQEAGWQLNDFNSFVQPVNDNTMVGTKTGFDQEGGSGNSYFGSNAGYGFTHGNGNTAIGAYTGYVSNIDGDNNTFLGFNAGTPSNTTIFNSSAIGTEASVTADNSMVLGRGGNGFGVAGTRILMGYTQPPTAAPSDTAARLYVNVLPGGVRAAFFNGTIYCVGVTNTSDAGLKTNVQPMGDVQTILDQINPKTFEFDVTNNPELNLPGGTQYGLIAQELETVLPGLVQTETVPATLDTLGNTVYAERSFKSINYTGLIPLLLQEIKNQNQRITDLEQLVSTCCGNGNIERRNQSTIEIELSNSIILNQNDPNPFAEQTRITYNIPEGVSEAKIVFSDNFGKVLQTVIINERGESQMIVYASNLSNGTYNYSLIADGKLIDSKKMVCSK
jgi:hypothetical protein